MPEIVVYCPHLDLAEKRAVVRDLTHALSRATGFGLAEIVVHVEEHAYTNVGVGGRLLSDLIGKPRRSNAAVRRKPPRPKRRGRV